MNKVELFVRRSKRPMRRIIFTSLWLFIGMCMLPSSYAQKDYPYSDVDHPLADLKKNFISFPEANFVPLNGFFKKMDDLIFSGKGRVNIVHIGGSHIQADMWSGQIRSRMQSFAPGLVGGRGFIFPFRLAKTNSPFNYGTSYTGTWTYCKNVQKKKVCDLGLSGMSATTLDPETSLRMYFKGKLSHQYEFNRIRVFHEYKESFDIELDTLADRVIEKVVNPSKGYTEFRLDTFLTVLKLKFVKTDSSQTHFTLYGLSLETEDPGFLYHAIGVNGASVPSYLRCNLFTQHLKTINPDLVVLSIGINDAYTPNFNAERFEANYDTLIQMIKAASPNCNILFTTNNDSWYKKRYPNKNGEKVRKSMFKMAKTHHAVVWDMYGVMGGLNSVSRWQQAGLARKDKIHFTQKGYELIGDLMFNALLKSYDEHLERTQF